MKKFRQTFIVEGSGYFPYDMLRYDACFPRHESESPLLGDPSTRNELTEVRRIELQRYIEVKHDLPTQGRWQSFGWHVIESSIKTEKI